MIYIYLLLNLFYLFISPPGCAADSVAYCTVAPLSGAYERNELNHYILDELDTVHIRFYSVDCNSGKLRIIFNDNTTYLYPPESVQFIKLKEPGFYDFYYENSYASTSSRILIEPKQLSHPAKTISNKVITVFPNPFTDVFKVSFIAESDDEVAFINVINSKGEVIIHEQLIVIKGLNEYHMNRNIPAGFYFIKFQLSDLTIEQKVLKIN